LSLLLLKQYNTLHALSEECSLVHWGKITEPSSVRLVDVNKIEDLRKFAESTIEDLYYVQPDLMVFKSNLYVENKRQTKTAGQPDLVVEVWSDGNSKEDREFKQYLYSTSGITEHWYIEQDSNDVVCYLGKERLRDQSLTDILVSRRGLRFDLRYLALK
jgi:Uma2 family endonuclease